MFCVRRIAQCAAPNLKKVFRNIIDESTRTKNPRNVCCNRSLSQSSSCLNRRYSDKHEWVSLDGKVATIGISQYAQEALGDVVYAQLPDIGTVIKQKEECGALESVKAASEVYSPVSGTVVEKNGAVEDTPSLVNQSCYDKGWLFKLEVSSETEVDELMTEEQYKEFLKTDHH